MILAHYCGDLDGRLSNRFVYLANIMVAHFDVELITSNYYHTKKCKKEVTGAYPFQITLIDEPAYTANIGLKRLYSHWKFSRNVKRYLMSEQMNPDLIYASFPSISIAKVAREYSKVLSIPFILDVQDLWPEAFKKRLSNIPFGFLISTKISNTTSKLFESADLLITVSNSFLEVIKKRSRSKASYVTYIGASWQRSNQELTIEKDEDFSVIDVVYLGSMGDSYDIKLLIDSFILARQKLAKTTSLRLTLIGDGEKRRELEEYAERLGVSVNFTGLLQHSEVQEILPKMDIAVNPIVPWSAASIINKHADYAMAGLPVINTQKSQEYQEILDYYSCGINVEHNTAGICDAIIDLAGSPAKRQKFRQNAYRMAKEKFDRESTYRELLKKVMNEMDEVEF